MTKITYWSKVLLELDTETGRIRILKGFHQPEKGTGTKKAKPKDSKAEQGEVIM